MSKLLAITLFTICRLILRTLHFAYSSVLYFDLVLAITSRKLKKLFLQIQGHNSQMIVSKFVKHLKKCPSHFVVIVDKDGISYEDFSNLVSWCLAAEINTVSFYDYTGGLKVNKNNYYKYLTSKGNINPNSLSFAIDKENHKNGHKITPKINLNILSLDDGKPGIVGLAKKISKDVACNKLNIIDINEQFINKEFFKVCGLPEPELAVVSGTICSSYGLLPWHIKVTEFLQVKSLRGIMVSDFTTILEKYSSCNQRFGK